jgi:membrane protein implicated in regulation of membrane protease activity
MDFTIYLFCLIVGLAFTLLTAVFGHLFGGDHGHLDGSGGHAEAGIDSSDSPGVSVLSPTIMACFVSAFGGFGIIFSKIPATKDVWLSAPLAVLGGGLVATAVLWVLRQLFRHSQGSSESKVATLVGVTATIITPIPENGVGEIAYIQGGTRYSAAARCETGASVPNGQVVTITRIVGTQFYVRPCTEGPGAPGGAGASVS